MGNRPTFKVLAVSERPDGLSNTKAYFTRIGSAWPRKNGPGYSIQLDALPLANGRLLLVDFDDELPPDAEADAPAAKAKK